MGPTGGSHFDLHCLTVSAKQQRRKLALRNSPRDDNLRDHKTCPDYVLQATRQDANALDAVHCLIGMSYVSTYLKKKIREAFNFDAMHQ